MQERGVQPSANENVAPAMRSGPIARKRVMLALGVLFNFLLPWAVYRLSEPRLGETHAIMASAVLPTLWSLVQLVRNQKVDVMSALVLSGIGLSLVALALGGSPKLLLFRESLITGLVGLVLIGSAMIGRPLMSVLLRSAARTFLSPQSALATALPGGVVARAREEWESFGDKPWFRRLMTVASIVCGLILVAETAVLCGLVFSMPTERVLLIRPIVRYCAAGLILLWTFLYFVPAVRREGLEE